MKPQKLDFSYLRKFCDNDEAFLQEMFATLLEKIPEELMQLEQSMQTSDAKAAYQAVHGMKSSLHLAGVPGIKGEMEVLEANVSANFADASTQARLHELIVVAQDTIQQLRKLHR